MSKFTWFCVFAIMWLFYSILVILYLRPSQSIWRGSPRCRFEIVWHKEYSSKYSLYTNTLTQTHARSQIQNLLFRIENVRKASNNQNEFVKLQNQAGLLVITHTHHIASHRFALYSVASRRNNTVLCLQININWYYSLIHTQLV